MDFTSKTIILATTAFSAPKKAVAPFHIASLMQAMGEEILIILVGEAIDLAHFDDNNQENAAKITAREQGESVLFFMQNAKKVGVKIAMCEHFYYKNKDTIKEIDYKISGGELAEILIAATKIISL